MTAELVTGLRALAEALPAGTAVPVPREVLLELLEASAGGVQTAATPLETSPNGAGVHPDQQLTVKEVAERFGLTTDWLYRHWRALGGVKHGRKVLRFPVAALARYMAARQRAP